MWCVVCDVPCGVWCVLVSMCVMVPSYMVLHLTPQPSLCHPSPTECEPGRHGPDCLLECRCHNGARCHPGTGACKCLPGWQGQHCNKKCNTGSWGQNCSGVCMCENNAECHHVTGKCQCAHGFIGERCEAGECGIINSPVPVSQR